MSNHQSDFIAIRAQLKACDNDNYLSSLFIGGIHSESLWTLYAFQCELAKISHIVQEPMLGKMRLQWWHDIITNAHQAAETQEQHEVLGHPIVDQLSLMMRRYHLEPEYFYKIIEARQLDLDHQFFEKQQDFENYHEAIWGNLYRLAYQILSFDQNMLAEASTTLEDPIFKIAGVLTGMLKFFSLADQASIKQHLALVLGQEVLQEGRSNLADHPQFLDYKQLQIKGLLEQFNLLVQCLEKSPKFEGRIFTPLGLAPYQILRWQKQEQALNIPWQINPLRHFFTLWRASVSGLKKRLG